jgi:hypothetical protein
MTTPEPNTHKDTKDLLDERNNTHGAFTDNARVSQLLKEVFRNDEGWQHLNTIHREAIDHICGKFGRIMAGKPDFDDHWDDIAGYALLPKKFNHGREPLNFK